MTNIELIFLALGICSDSFVLSICKGVISKHTKKTAIKCAVFFTFFQVLFIILGYFFGNILNKFISGFQGIVVFFIFFILALNIFKEGFSEDNDGFNESIVSYILLSISSSVDSLSVGLSLALYEQKIFILLGFVVPFTVIFSVLGVVVGKFAGVKYKKAICITSSLILLYFGFKFLIS